MSSTHSREGAAHGHGSTGHIVPVRVLLGTWALCAWATYWAR